MKNNGNNELSVRWRKCEIIAKLLASIIASIVIPTLIFFVSNRIRQQELNLRYLQVSLGLLVNSPDKHSSVFRPWAVKVFKDNAKGAGFPISEEMEKSLLKEGLPISRLYTMSGGGVAGGSAPYEFHHVSPGKSGEDGKFSGGEAGGSAPYEFHHISPGQPSGDK